MPTERVATEHLCIYCREPITRRADRAARNITKCEACSRHVLRTVGAVSDCCEALTVMEVRPQAAAIGGVAPVRYCPACPGAGKVPVLLVGPDGREREAFWTPDTPVGSLGWAHLKLRDLASRCELDPSALVIYMRDVRSWALAWPRVDVRRVVDGQARRRTAKRRANILKVRARDRQYQARRRKQLAPVECSSCGRERVPYSVAHRWCSACAQRAGRNGVCSRPGCVREGQPRRKRARGGECYCPGCSRASQALRSPGVLVSVTDGERMREVLVERQSRIGGHHADAWVSPLVLVDDVRIERMALVSAPVVGGVVVPWSGSASRMLLRELWRRLPGGRGSPEAVARALREAVGGHNYGGSRRVLMRALLLDDGGVTDRGRALLRWAEAAGVGM